MNFKALISWSKKHYSELPWRKKRTLYSTLVSEIMLQQTTVGTVLNHYERFLKEFPNIQTLSGATEEQLAISWKGLGYYRRARNLLKAAQTIVNEYGGRFPKTTEELISIPGIGPYTANALQAIGRDKPAIALDANLERVLSRLYGVKVLKGPKLQKELQELFTEKKILKNSNKYSARDLNEALMDLGRVYCQARKADCMLCPLKKNCAAFKSGSPLDFPVQETKKKERHSLVLLRVLVKKHGQLLVYKKNEKEWLSGQYEVPTFILKSSDKNLIQYPNASVAEEGLPSFKTGITKYTIENKVLILSEKDFYKRFGKHQKYEFVKISDQANFSTSSFKALNII